jgi:hypothetical protein
MAPLDRRFPSTPTSSGSSSSLAAPTPYLSLSEYRTPCPVRPAQLDLSNAKSRLRSTASAEAQTPGRQTPGRKSTMPGMPMIEDFLEEIKTRSGKLRKVRPASKPAFKVNAHGTSLFRWCH